MDIEVVRASLAYRKVGLDGQISEQETVLFRYSNALPFAVHLFFPKAAWTFSRDLLVEGTMIEDEDTGDGDVYVRPVRDGVEITLRSPTGHSVLLFDLGEVLDALDKTRELVEYGAESDVFDLDGWLSVELPEAA